MGLIFFGVEGFRTPAFWDGRVQLGSLSMSGQSVIVLVVTAILIGTLSMVFARTLYGKALRAAASNSTGARLLAISVSFSGRLSFAIAAFIGALCGLLIAPIVTIYYDSGLLIGLKGFVASIFGGLSSYAFTLLGALAIGVVESFSSFLASAYKETIVFLLVIPVLLWLSTRGGFHEEEH
jgi:branched-chain amino acid transport system permease protein